MARVFYRLMESDPPTESDFLSLTARGAQLGPDDDAELFRGVSVQATEAQILKKARIVRVCAFYAVIEIPFDSDIRIARTLRSPGHHTVWGDPKTLIRYVVAVRPVRREAEES